MTENVENIRKQYPLIPNFSAPISRLNDPFPFLVFMVNRIMFSINPLDLGVA